MTTETDWEEWGASPACGYAINCEEGAPAASTRNYADAETPVLPVNVVSAWYVQNGITHALMTLNEWATTLANIPTGGEGFYGNDSSLAARGQSVIWLAMTGPMGHDSHTPYLNIEVGEVLPSQEFFEINIAHGAGAIPASRINVGSNPETNPWLDIAEGNTAVPTFRYFLAVHISYCDDADDWNVGGFRVESNVQAFSITGVPIISWKNKVQYLTTVTGNMAVDGGIVPSFPAWNTNIYKNAATDPDEDQHIKAYAMFWGGKRKRIHDLQDAANYLGPKWAVGDMAIWRPWITMDPTGNDRVGGVVTNRRRRR